MRTKMFSPQQWPRLRDGSATFAGKGTADALRVLGKLPRLLHELRRLDTPSRAARGGASAMLGRPSSRPSRTCEHRVTEGRTVCHDVQPAIRAGD